PNSQQKVLNYGSDSPLVGKTLLTAKQLLESNFLKRGFDTEGAITGSFECLKELAVMFDLSQLLKAQEEEARKTIDGMLIQNRSLTLPSARNLEAHCKEFIQRADHSLQVLFGIAALFYGKSFKGYFEGLAELVSRVHKDDPQFIGFMAEAAV